MEATTYRKLAELIRESYYRIVPSDDASLSLRYFAELIPTEVATCAYEDAIDKSNAGETTYASGQFISEFKNQNILVDADGTKYGLMPATPASLPNDQEITEVNIVGGCLSVIPMTSRASFSQSLIGLPRGFVFYKVEGGKIVFESSNPLIEGAFNIKMVGAVPGGDLLSSSLTIPKNYESRIITRIMARLLPLKNQPIDYINDAISNPS